MEKITSEAELKSQIRMLEIRKANEWRLLREEIKTTYEHLKPASLIKNTLHELAVAPDLKGDLMNTSLGLAVGHLSKKVMLGSTRNPIKKLLGTFLQMGVTNVFLKNADGIKAVTIGLMRTLFSKKNSTH